MEFDPDAYTIAIRKEKIDDEVYYVGRVAELPNITAFEDTYEAAHAIVIDAIQTFKKIADETGNEFPFPYSAPSIEFSGRITLRLPKSLHAKISFNATQENVSVNQYLTTAIATYVGESEGISKVTTMVKRMMEQVASSASISMRSSSIRFNILTNQRVQHIDLDNYDLQTTKPMLLKIGARS